MPLRNAALQELLWVLTKKFATFITTNDSYSKPESTRESESTRVNSFRDLVAVQHSEPILDN